MNKNLVIGITLSAVIALVDLTFVIVDKVEERKRRRTNDILNSFLEEELRRNKGTK